MSYENVAFKEKEGDNNQYLKDENGNWVSCNENYISSLWCQWMSSNRKKVKYTDEEGFLVFDYKD